MFEAIPKTIKWEIDEFIASISFEWSKLDTCVYFKFLVEDNLYVNDILIVNINWNEWSMH